MSTVPGGGVKQLFRFGGGVLKGWLYGFFWAWRNGEGLGALICFFFQDLAEWFAYLQIGSRYQLY